MTATDPMTEPLRRAIEALQAMTDTDPLTALREAAQFAIDQLEVIIEAVEFGGDIPTEATVAQNRLRAALASEGEGPDVERLATALLKAVPGYQRWLTPPPTSGREAAGRTDAMESEALAHARLIAAEYARLPRRNR